jgi:hypothetical protein
MKQGDVITLNVPENPRLHQTRGTVQVLTEWGAFVNSPAAETGQFRALFSEMLSESESRQIVREQGYTGDVCDRCGSLHMRRNGSCLLCMDCGSTSGCS